MEKLTHIGKLRDPNYLGHWDLQDESGKTTDIIVTIEELSTAEAYNQRKRIEETVVTVHFKECKPIILNRKNEKMLKKILKTDFIERMVGNRVQLTTKREKCFGEMMDVIRVVDKLPGAIVKVVTVDIKACLEKLDVCKTKDDLAKTWKSFSPSEQNQPEVLAKKELLKTKLK